MHSNRTKHIVITGANGFIGLTLTEFFCNKGYHVTALVRKIPSNTISTVKYRLYCLESNLDMDFFTPNSIVIHCAYSKKEEKINGEDVNELATKHLISEAKKYAIQKCIFISSFSVKSNADSYYARQKSKLETLFNSEKHLIIRPSLVIGNDGLFYKTISNLKKIKILPLINRGNQPIYYVGISDLVNYIANCIEKNSSGIHDVSNPNPILYNQFYSRVAYQLDFKIIPILIPLSLMKFGVFLNSFLPNPMLSKDNLKGLVATSKLKMETVSDFNYQSLDEILNDFKW